MKRKLSTCLCIVLALSLIFRPEAFAYLFATQSVVSALSLAELSRDPVYNESVAPQSDNPERGFYETGLLKLTPSGKPADWWVTTKSEKSKLMQLKVDLSAFSGNMNESGTNIALTGEAIQELRNALAAIKSHDNTTFLRFVYDGFASALIPGKTKCEPDQATLVNHIAQLSDVFKEYATTINAIQVGFYGLWGECYYNTDATTHSEYYPETVNALLAATAGTDINIALRTPQYYAWYRGLPVGSLDGDVTSPGSDAYRVGVFNDAYGASESDLGTYVNRVTETAWLNNQASHTFYGGEAIVDSAYDAGTSSSVIGAYNHPNYFIDEAFKIHTTYLNSEWRTDLHAAWASLSYGEENALDYISKHLGYRLSLRGVKHFTTNADPDGKWGEYPLSSATDPLNISFDVMIGNTGFANVIKQKQAEILVRRPSGELCHREMLSLDELDIRKVPSLGVLRARVNLTNLVLPFKGDYEVYLRLSSGEQLEDETYYSSIKLANDGIYNEDLQGNLLTRLRVTTGEPDSPATPPPPQTNFAVYSASDNSLNFYRMDSSAVPTAGDANWDGLGHDATDVYKNFEKEIVGGALADNGPWHGRKADIKSVKVVSTGIRPFSIAYWFNGFSNCESFDLLNLDVSRVLSMESAFNGCASPNFKVLDLSTWDTAKVKNMGGMFAWCNALETIFVDSRWSTGSVTFSEKMFCSSSGVLRGGAGTRYIDKVWPESPDGRDAWFARIDGGAGLEGFLTKKPDASTVLNFAVYSDTDKSLRFYNRTGLPAKGETFNDGDGILRVVTDIYYGFDKGVGTDGPANALWRDHRGEVESITVVDNGVKPVNCAFWFDEFSKVNTVDVLKLNVSAVTNMWAMFRMIGSDGASTLTELDISTWNTANVVKMRQMFQYHTKLTTIVVGSGWNTAAVSDSAAMFESSWSTSLVGGAGTRYVAGQVCDKAFTRIDGGVGAEGYLTLRITPSTVLSFAVYSDTDNSLRFYHRAGMPAVGDVFNDGETTPDDIDAAENAAAQGVSVPAVDRAVTAVYYNFDLGEGKDAVENAPWRGHGAQTKIIRVVDNGIAPKNCAYWFNQFTVAETVNLLKLDVSNVKNMRSMFSELSVYGTAENALKVLNLSTWNTSKVEIMETMFCWSTALETIYVDRNKWSTEKVSSSAAMFKSWWTALVGGAGTRFDPTGEDVGAKDASYARVDGVGGPGYFTDIADKPPVVASVAVENLSLDGGEASDVDAADSESAGAGVVSANGQDGLDSYLDANDSSSSGEQSPAGEDSSLPNGTLQGSDSSSTGVLVSDEKDAPEVGVKGYGDEKTPEPEDLVRGAGVLMLGGIGVVNRRTLGALLSRTGKNPKHARRSF